MFAFFFAESFSLKELQQDWKVMFVALLSECATQKIGFVLFAPWPSLVDDINISSKPIVPSLFTKPYKIKPDQLTNKSKPYQMKPIYKAININISS